MNKTIFLILFLVALHFVGHTQTPVNDNCNSAIELNVSLSCMQTVGTVSLATQSILPITCGVGTSAASKDVWYKFTATSTTATINVSPNTQGGNNFNIVASLYSACNGSLIACADNLGNLQTETISAGGLTAGNVYFINLYQYKNNVGSADPANPTFSVCVTSDIASGLNSFTLNDESINVYPNPFVEKISILSDINEVFSIKIYDILGKWHNTCNGVSRNIIIDTKEYPSSIYFLQIYNQNNQLISTKKLIKL
jgi:hypothetical protein